MPPTIERSPHRKFKSKSESVVRTLNNNDIPIPETPILPQPTGPRYPADEDRVRFWPYACSQDCGRNLLQVTSSSKKLTSDVEGHVVDFNGVAYDYSHPHNNFRSEFMWSRSESTAEGIHLRIHDPKNVNDKEFPYVLCMFNYNKKGFRPFAIKSKYLTDSRFSTTFKIQPISWGQSSWLFMINDIKECGEDERLTEGARSEEEEGLSPFFIGRTPDGRAIQMTSVLHQSLLNPMALMFMSDHGR